MLSTTHPHTHTYVNRTSEVRSQSDTTTKDQMKVLFWVHTYITPNTSPTHHFPHAAHHITHTTHHTSHIYTYTHTSHYLFTTSSPIPLLTFTFHITDCSSEEDLKRMHTELKSYLFAFNNDFYDYVNTQYESFVTLSSRLSAIDTHLYPSSQQLFETLKDVEVCVMWCVVCVM